MGTWNKENQFLTLIKSICQTQTPEILGSQGSWPLKSEVSAACFHAGYTGLREPSGSPAGKQCHLQRRRKGPLWFPQCGQADRTPALSTTVSLHFQKPPGAARVGVIAPISQMRKWRPRALKNGRARRRVQGPGQLVIAFPSAQHE